MGYDAEAWSDEELRDVGGGGARVSGEALDVGMENEEFEAEPDPVPWMIGKKGCCLEGWVILFCALDMTLRCGRATLKICAALSSILLLKCCCSMAR